MSKKIDLTGQHFGRLTVLNYVGNRKWECKCDCGNTKIIRGDSLRNGYTNSCGCITKEFAGKKAEDLTGKIFGKLTVIKRSENKGKRVMWVCRCECGNETIVSSGHLKEGATKSCGCLLSEKSTNISGKKFGKLTAIKPNGKNKKGQILWLCKCDCGSDYITSASNMLCGNTTSCGCSRRKNGLILNRRIYSIWNGMKNRCYNSSHIAFKNYGGRGIIICNEWLHDFQAFYGWAIANGYSDDLTIDRIDTNGNYEPSNCRWVSMKVQANNTRKNIKVTYNGEIHTISEWIEIIGVSRRVMENRIKKYGHNEAVRILMEGDIK